MVKEHSLSGKDTLWGEAALFSALFVVMAVWNHWSGERFLPSHPQLFHWIDGLIVQNVIWVLPVMLYLQCRQPTTKWQPEELMRNPFPWREELILACFCACVQNTIRLINYWGVEVYAPFRMAFIPRIIGPAFTEEVFFRGFLFNRMMAVWPAWGAVLGSSACFMLYHYPGLFTGMSVGELFCMRSLLLLTMGAVFALFLKRNQNLPSCMALHGFWNLLSYLFALYY